MFKLYLKKAGLWMKNKVVIIIIVLALLAGVGIITAVADVNGGWSIDGNVPDGESASFIDPYGSVSELGPVNSNETKLGVIHSAGTPMLEFTNPNAQVDLREVYLGTKIDSVDHTWLYFGWRRDSKKGSGVIMFEFQQAEMPEGCVFPDPPLDMVDDPAIDAGEQYLIENCNPWANRQAGDFVIVWDQVGKDIKLWYREFYYDEVESALVLGDSIALDTSVSAAVYSDDGYFGEAAIDLSETVFEEGVCESFANVIPGTLTGNSDTADFKDTVLGDFGLQISNCGTLNVKKVVTNDDGGTLTCPSFTYEVDDDDPVAFEADCQNKYSDELFEGDYTVVEPAVAGYTTTYADSTDTTDEDCNDVYVEPGESATCTITNDDIPPYLKLVKTLTKDDGGDAVSNNWTLYAATSDEGYTDRNFSRAGDSDQFVKVYANHGYVLSEAGPDGYTAGSWSCDVEGVLSGSVVTLGLGENVTCTINNDDVAPQLTLVKVVTNNDGGNNLASEWTLTASGTGGFSGTGTQDSGENKAVLGPNNVKANTTYTLSESGGPSGYTEGTVWLCEGGHMVGDDGIWLDEGTSATCTITNNDIAPTLKLVKTVTNDNGGTNDPVDWILTATADVIDFTGPNYEHPGNYGSFVPIYSNTDYILGETGPASPSAVYTPGNWTCDKDVTVTDGKINLPEGKTEVTCTINNDDEKEVPTGTTVMAWSLWDSLHISGIRAGGEPAASVTFYLYRDDQCTDLVSSVTDNSITALGWAGPSAIYVSQPGTYYWRAVYSGDSYNVGFTTPCGHEITTISETNLYDSD